MCRQNVPFAALDSPMQQQHPVDMSFAETALCARWIISALVRSAEIAWNSALHQRKSLLIYYRNSTPTTMKRMMHWILIPTLNQSTECHCLSAACHFLTSIAPSTYSSQDTASCCAESWHPAEDDLPCAWPAESEAKANRHSLNTALFWN